jgi:hypothetical protein
LYQAPLLMKILTKNLSASHRSVPPLSAYWANE